MSEEDQFITAKIPMRELLRITINRILQDKLFLNATEKVIHTEATKYWENLSQKEKNELFIQALSGVLEKYTIKDLSGFYELLKEGQK